MMIKNSHGNLELVNRSKYLLNKLMIKHYEVKYEK